MYVDRKSDWNSQNLTRSAYIVLFVILIAAFLVRISVFLFFPSIIQGDEIFQYLEQGYRLNYGQGLVPWEYIVGIRSWVFPGLIGGIIALARTMGDTPEGMPLVAAAFMCLASLLPILCSFLWGWRAVGLYGAISCGVLNAFWFETVYFAPHTLSENISADLLVAGLFCIYPAPPSGAVRRLFAGGLLLGFTIIFRLQLLPAIAIAVLMVNGIRSVRYCLPIYLGIVIPILLVGLLDGLTWSWPFQSFLLYFWVNFKEGIAAQFGTAPVGWYLSMILGYWSASAILVIFLALYGGRRYPLLLIVAATIFLSHSLQGHKEYRFIFPVVPLLLVLAGIGLAMAVRQLQPTIVSRGAGLAALAGISIFWVGTSVVLARSDETASLWLHQRGAVQSWRIIDRDAAACGVGIAPTKEWSQTAGYSSLRPGLTLYGYNQDDPDRRTEAFNYLIAINDPRDFAASGFAKLDCWPSPEPSRKITSICLWRRPGACGTNSEQALSATANLPLFLRRLRPEWPGENGH